MSKFFLWTLSAFALLASLLMAGCGGDRMATSDTATVAVRGARVGETVEIGDGLTVTLVSVDTSLPASLDASPQPSPHWMLLEVKNSSDASATFPSRPIRPTVIDADGNSLEVRGIAAGLVDGGGGWGPTGARRGDPYANPGGMMRVWCELPDWPTAERPLTVTYAPTRQGSALFVVE